MKILYLDKFRGFHNTFLPLANVNFFVGENSSGKSSILSLITLLSSERFWETMNFNVAGVELGYFNDINNKNTRFTIAFAKESFSYSKPKSGIATFYFLRFKNRNGIPFLEQLYIKVDTFDVKVSFNHANKSSISYKSTSEVKWENSLRSFKSWVRNLNSNSNGNYKKITLPRGLETITRFPTLGFAITHAIHDDIVKRKRGELYSSVNFKPLFYSVVNT